ncbi:MAG: STAS domain-containing protein [Acidiferrobacterales bacterium]|nr:STAS domain-containing protein [Acidiferrobacterales bacterium]
MDIPTERVDGALILQPSGRIDGQNAVDFQTAIESIVTDSDNAVVLELTDLVYISSAGLRVILLLAKTLKSRNAQFAMCSISGSVKDVFDISGFGKIISTHDTREGALSSMNS